MSALMRSARSTTISATCNSLKPCSLSRSRPLRQSAACRDIRVRYTRDEDKQTGVDVPPADRVVKPSSDSSLSPEPEYNTFRTQGETSWEGSAMNDDADVVQRAKEYWNRIEVSLDQAFMKIFERQACV